jgi:Tol biopolymer transport system component
MNSDGSDQRRLTQRPGNEAAPDWSPDGRAIVFTAGPDGPRIGNSADGPYRDVYVMNADGSGQRNLTHTIAGDTYMSWSPDGRRLAFYDDDAIYVVGADRSGLRRLTQNVPFGGAIWSPDGRKIAFIRLRHPKKIQPGTGAPPPPTWPAADLHVMNADGSGQRNLTRTPTASDGWAATWARSQGT